jgi:hypothetical protein
MKPILCQFCERPKTALFYSLTCPSCDYAAMGRFYRGYIVAQGTRKGIIPTYVWAQAQDALEWSLRHSASSYVKVVLSNDPFQWDIFALVPHTEDLVLVHPDHRYAPGPGRAFLAPPEVPLDCGDVISLPWTERG